MKVLYKRNGMLIPGIIMIFILMGGMVFGAISAQERAALIAFYNANEGDHWLYNSGWKGYNNEPDGFSHSGTENGWYGVGVTGDTVTGITQYNEAHITQLPAAMSNLSNLEVLMLPGCKISGNFPGLILGFTKLNTLYLSGNELTGSIPRELQNLTSLIYISLSGNHLSGSIPPELGNMSQLRSLDLGSNDLTGSIPAELGNLTNLFTFSVYQNRLSGSIPSSLGRYQYILNLAFNQLTGTIPKNSIYGPSSTGLGRCIFLNDNNLSGSIPASDSGYSSAFQMLDLHNNNLSGPIPSSLFKNAGFEGDPSFMDLSHNNLTGSIPPEIGDCFMAEWIDLSHNKLSGSIPKEFADLVYNPAIDLSFNELSGEVPKDFWGFYWWSINLSGNMLSGIIPVELIQHETDRVMDIGYNSFSASDGDVIAYLNKNDPDWKETQTVLPVNISAAATSANSIRVSWSPILYKGNSGGYMVYYCTSPSGSWIKAGRTATKEVSFYDVTDLKPGTVYYFMVRTVTDQCEKNHNIVVTGFSDMISASTPYVQPTISVSRNELFFGGIIGHPAPGTQSFTIRNTGGGVLNWTASPNQSWLHVSSESGTGWKEVAVSVDLSGLSAGTYNGVIAIAAAEATNSPQSVQVQLIVKSAEEDQPPFGYLETPLPGTTVSGSVPVTGWALDDTGVDRVKIFRIPVVGETGDLIYIGDALFVEGARPDIEVAFPGYPMNYKAGWGYMLLTNFLPNQGNGTFTLHAVAYDMKGKSVTLGATTITCDNANAVKPFGAIDTPAQGEVVSGSDYVNFGWCVTPLPNIIPMDGSTISVYIDGKMVGHPGYNQYREDIAGLFAGLNNSDGAGGYFYIDTRGYTNGMHSISWTVSDNAGNEDGIGSRYFMIQNPESDSSISSSSSSNVSSSIKEWCETPENSILVKKRFNRVVEPVSIVPGENGVFSIDLKELEPIEIHFPIGVNRVTPLPVGSTWDDSGIFYWIPGPGFIGKYFLEFDEKDKKGNLNKRRILIGVRPKF